MYQNIVGGEAILSDEEKQGQAIGTRCPMGVEDVQAKDNGKGIAVDTN